MEVIKRATLIGIALLLSGCTSSPEVEKYPYDSNKRQLAVYGEEHYYFRPEYSWSHRLDANTANMNTVASSGLITCKENDIWFISMNDKAEEAEVRYRYTITLAKSQLMEIEDNATYIPRRDSQEFKDLKEIDTRLAREGLIGCSPQLTDEQVSRTRIQR